MGKPDAGSADDGPRGIAIRPHCYLARTIGCSAVLPRSGGERVSWLGLGCGERLWKAGLLDSRAHRWGDSQAARTGRANCSRLLVTAEEFYKSRAARCSIAG